MLLVNTVIYNKLRYETTLLNTTARTVSSIKTESFLFLGEIRSGVFIAQPKRDRGGASKTNAIIDWSHGCLCLAGISYRTPLAGQYQTDNKTERSFRKIGDSVKITHVCKSSSPCMFLYIYYLAICKKTGELS